MLDSNSCEINCLGISLGLLNMGNGNMKMGGNCVSLGVLNDDNILKLDWYDDETVFNNDCDSCKYKCLDIG